jgi:hypothetical protein
MIDAAQTFVLHLQCGHSEVESQNINRGAIVWRNNSFAFQVRTTQNVT